MDNNFKKPHRKWITNNEENEENVLLSINENPKTSLFRVSQITGVSKTSTQRILKQNKYHPYKPHFINTLKERDYDRRFEFCAWLQGEIEGNRHFLKYLLFTDEAKFSSNGTVSSQNCRWWADENPNFTIECRDQYSFTTNVWCAIFNNKIIGPYFFRENINSELYLHFLMFELEEVINHFSDEEKEQLWFQQDGAPCHSTQIVREYLDYQFRGKWIGRNSTHPWPARSPDLTPLDFFLWGYLKNKVYSYRPFQNINHMENVIRECCTNITESILKNVNKEVFKRTIKCMEVEGRHVEI